MSLKQRLAFRLKECFSALGNRSDSPDPARAAVARPDGFSSATPRRRLGGVGGGLRGGSGRIDEAQLAQLGLARAARQGVSASFVDQLVSALVGGDDEEKVWAAEVVVDFAVESEESRSCTSLLAVVPPLVKMLQQGTAKARLCAAYALSTLSSHEDSRGEMERCGAVRPLVAMLRSAITPVDGKKCALRTLERLARSDSASLQIFHAGGLKPIITLLSSNDTSLLKRCLVALYFVGADKDELQQEILKAGALPVVLELCRSAHQSIQAEAVDVCKVLSRSGICSEKMAEAGAVEVLVRVAGEGLSQRSRNTALQALQRMSECSAGLKEKIAKLGTVLRFDDLSDDEISELVGIFSSGDDRLRAQAAKVVEQVAAADPKASRCACLLAS